MSEVGLLLESHLRKRRVQSVFAYVEGRWKLIVMTPRRSGQSSREPNAGDGRLRMLFDRRIDPAEKNDLSSRHPEIVGRLSKRLHAAIREAEATAEQYTISAKQILSQEQLDRLEALGYADPDRAQNSPQHPSN